MRSRAVLPEKLAKDHEFLVAQMHIMRRKGLALPKTDPAYGMPVGDDLDDTAGTSITCGTTYYRKGDFEMAWTQPVVPGVIRPATTTADP